MTKHQRYNRSPKGQERNRRYWDSPKGRATRRRDHVRTDALRRSTAIQRYEEALNSTLQ